MDVEGTCTEAFRCQDVAAADILGIYPMETNNVHTKLY